MSLNSESNENKTNEIKIVLQLGDVIRITDPTNEKLNNQTFIIDYIDQSKTKLINVDSLEIVVLVIDDEGIIGNGTITNITIVSRSEFPGYARQNGLLPGTWINIFMETEPPAIFTGEITNLEEDMIEIKTYPDGMTIYINFDYKGFPEDLPIQDIEIREKPSKQPTPQEEGEELEEGEIREERPSIPTDEIPEGQLPELGDQEITKPTQTIAVPVASVKDQLREIILRGNQIQFLDEYIGPIKQYKNVDKSTQRYSLEAQTSDLLDELLSTIPNVQRTPRVLNNIHTMIERFIQLRESFSHFDEYGNVDAATVNEATFKPLTTYLKKFNSNLYWILPVVKNMKKIYVDNSATSQNERGDVLYIDINEDHLKMNNIIETYKSNSNNDEQNKYFTMYSDLNPYFTPFEYLDDEITGNVIYEVKVKENINSIVDNLTNFYSSIMTNNGIKSRRFVIQKYNLGLDRLEAINMKGSQMITRTVKLTNSDTLSVSSILTLPEPVIRFSRINLNNTSILDRANLNETFVNYWELFKKNTFINNVNVDLIDQEIEFDENNFANNVKNFVLDIPKEDLQGNEKQIYREFINTIVPKTKVLFNLMKKYITGRLSIVEVVNYLEPFLIYTDNLTYMQYLAITKFISEKISEHNKNFVERSRIFSTLKRSKNENQFYRDAYSIINMIDEKQNLREEIFEAYNFYDIASKTYSNSEILRKLKLLDDCKLYTSTLSLQNVPLMFPHDFSPILDSEKQQIDNLIKNDSSSDSCKNYVIAKMYNSEEELKGDNGNEHIYFDKKYDTTDYGFLDNFEKEMIEKTPEDFIVFLINKIKEKKKFNDEEAEYFADTLINGYKKVINGQYAILNDQLNENNEYTYYIRKNNEWVFDPNVDPKLISDSQNILCNLQNKCITAPSNIDDKCESTKLNELQLQQSVLKSVMNEFDLKYNISKQEYEAKIKAKFEYNLGIMPILIKIQNDNFLKYNNIKYKLGEKLEGVVPSIVSPYSKLKNLIMGQQDFVKKQYDINTFAMMFTRKAILNSVGPLGEVESEHWLYCTKTNVKLMPTFIYEMASAYITYINEPQKYNDFVELLIHKIGAVLNADGDAWVDIHSGEVIKQISLDEDEGYENGFRVTTRAVLEEDISIPSLPKSSTTKKYDTPETIMINNVINAISVSMGINIESQKEFIMGCVVEKIKELMPKESSYTKQIKDAANKGKTILSYKELYSSVLLYNTLGMTLIAIQTNTEPMKTKKTFPGCIRSFTGYPFEGAGDLSSLKYLACVAYKIRSPDTPWNVLSKKKEMFIETKIKETIDGTDRIVGLINMSEVKRKIEEKLEYLILNPEQEIPEEHNILNWTQFLPPLVPIKLKQLLNISDEFKERLENELKSGSKAQREKILIVESKIILFSLAIQERIQNVINSKQLILRKSSNEPYLENACCNEKDIMTTLQYFEKEDQSIREYNTIVKRLTDIINDITFYSKPTLLYSPFNTKNIYPSISEIFSEETIYLAFIRFCNLRSLKPIHSDLLTFCANKPDTINENDTLIEVIRKLKEDRREFTEPNFLRLLQIVSRKNIMKFTIDKNIVSSITKFSNVLTVIDDENDEVIERSLVENLNDCLDTYDIASSEISQQTRTLNIKLNKDNKIIKNKIIEFITKNKDRDVTSRNIRDMTSFINNLSDWALDKTTRKEELKISNDALYNIINFYKVFIQNTINVFPNIILNNVDYQNIQIPNYWGLSMNHASKIRSAVTEYYSVLRKFYDAEALTNILEKIQKSGKNILLLSNNTPSFTTIKKGEQEIKPIFDEKTSKLLFEHYLLLVFMEYINLADVDEMIVTKKKTDVNVLDIFSTQFLEESERKTETIVAPRTEIDITVLRGNKKELKQKVSNLLLSFIQIMNKEKDMINISYEDIQDKVFKIREKEKDLMTDRLKGLTEEEREADTILKINKLGPWDKGLQKSLTRYSADDYDKEREFMEIMTQFERNVGNETNPSRRNFSNIMDDYIEDQQRENDIEREAYDISGYTENYMDGNFEGDEVDYGDYGDYDS